MKKDDLLEITIEDISSDGSGVGKADGFALFVKDTIPGDQVKVKIMKMKKRYGYARLMEILVPSPDRIQAPCPVARQCGGCQIQQMSYERQLTFKENKVCNNLRRLGGSFCDGSRADLRHGRAISLPQQSTVSDRPR